MPRDPRHDILFEPVRIGPKTARNRFYQVPHCNGMGYRYPQSLAAMRGVKAEGGWAVVCTEEVEIHPSTEVMPANEGRLWSDEDIPYHTLTVEAIQAHGSLAGIELVHQGGTTKNRYSRIPPMGPSAHAIAGTPSMQARAMDKSDIRALRGWYRDAALRAKQAGYDLIYVYAGHDLSVLQHFISRKWNQRSDEYGGSLENRVRLFREVLEDTKDAVGDSMAVAVRFAVDELEGPEGITHDGEGRAVVELLADIPDLWDVNISDWPNDSQTARFAPNEGYQDEYIKFVKTVTGRPVVAVGRYTSADGMAKRIRDGVLDFIGAARPSIADPFLPRKIEEGRYEDIRECIGCNICVSGDNENVPYRCTQNPTMGEEWRRQWHPERIARKASDDPVLVVGSGPAGLECAMQLAKRGYPVTLAEASSELGGRVTREARLPGLASYGRVRDYRVQYLQVQANVDIYLESPLTAADIAGMDTPHVYLATGAAWRRDCVGASLRTAPDGLDRIEALTPEDIMDGARPSGRVLIYDDDNYYLGGVLAEKLLSEDFDVAIMTKNALISQWTELTMEQHRVQRRLLEMGARLYLSRHLVRLEKGAAVTACVFTGQEDRIAADTVIPVTARQSDDRLFESLRGTGLKTLKRIGDAFAPGSVAAAVYAGHLAARRHEGSGDDTDIFRTERVTV